MSHKPQVSKTSAPVCLNIGCGSIHLDGFINIDIDEVEGVTDLIIDVRDGLPFEDQSVDVIFSEHFIEHLDQAEGIRFMMECRRVLKASGTLRLATPDLDALVEEYGSKEHWLHSDWESFGYGWIQNPCEMLNIAMHEWGHRYLYNEAELRRLTSMVGFHNAQRCQLGISQEASLCEVEYRKGSRLIMEFRKPQYSIAEDSPLVSIAIPAYRADFLEEALQSVAEQTYKNIEVVITDDSNDAAIANIVQAFKKNHPFPLFYTKNTERLGGGDNQIEVVSRCNGDYIKMLCDDDVLMPECVERMVLCLQQYPNATLVTSHRQRIDHQGYKLKDLVETRRPVGVDKVIRGSDLLQKMLNDGVNFIGEPTTAMFRKQSIQMLKPHLLSFAGIPASANGDVTLWVNLLMQGDAIYLYESLSCFRHHPGQDQKQEGYSEIGKRAWTELQAAAERKGILQPALAGQKLNGQVLHHKPWWSQKHFSLIHQIQTELEGALTGAVLSAKTQKDIQTLLESNPNHPLYKTLFSQWLLASSKIYESQRYLEESLKIHPEFTPAITTLIHVLMMTGEYVRADECFADYHETHPWLEFSKGYETTPKGMNLKSSFELWIREYCPNLELTLDLGIYESDSLKQEPIHFEILGPEGQIIPKIIHTSPKELQLVISIPHRHHQQSYQIRCCYSESGAPVRVSGYLFSVTNLNVDLLGIGHTPSAYSEAA